MQTDKEQLDQITEHKYMVLSEGNTYERFGC